MNTPRGMKGLMEMIEAEAQESGPEDVAHLRALEQHYRLSAQLAEMRVARKLSQRALAALAHVPQADISRIEGGQANPTEATILALLAALDAEITIAPRAEAAVAIA